MRDPWKINKYFILEINLELSFFNFQLHLVVGNGWALGRGFICQKTLLLSKLIISMIEFSVSFWVFLLCRMVSLYHQHCGVDLIYLLGDKIECVVSFQFCCATNDRMPVYWYDPLGFVVLINNIPGT